MSDLASIDSLEIALSRCRKRADALGNEYLAYLLDMAILEARSISRARRGAERAERGDASSASGDEAPAS
jgi:hypothetical protein